MTDRLTALVALKEAVKNDLEVELVVYKNAFGEHSTSAALANILKSMNAALSLLAAVLPSCDWGRSLSGQMWVKVDGRFFLARAHDPARALLLAIIVAKIEGERNAG